MSDFSTDPLFVGSPQRKAIIKSYIRLKMRPSQEKKSMVKRVVEDLGKYKLNGKNNSNSFVSRVIKDFNKQVKGERGEN